MMRQAFQSYLATLHPRKSGKYKENPRYFVHAFISLCIFIWILEWINMWIVVSKAIPLFLIKWSNLQIGSNMGKAMLLCPMTKESRKEYMNFIIGFKIGCPVVLEMLIEMMWSMIYGFDIRRFLLMVIIYTSYGIAETIHIDVIDKIDHRILPGKKDATGNVKWAWLNFLVGFISLVLVLNYGLTELESMEGQFYAIVTSIGSALLIIMDIIIICTQYKDMVEEATDYELAFHIPGRLYYIKTE